MTGPKSALQIEWDRDGQTLAVLQDGHNTVLLYSLREKSVKEIDVSSKEPTYMCWSKVSSHLAIGTSKGNLVIYEHATKKLVTHQGKHSKLVFFFDYTKRIFMMRTTGASLLVHGTQRIVWLSPRQISSSL